MQVLIGVDPHKASLAVATVDEATGEPLERASFPQSRTGLRSLAPEAPLVRHVLRRILLKRTSDLFNSGQELGGLQPLSF